MESRFQSALVENEILEERNKRVETPAIGKISYAQAAAMRMHEPRPQDAVSPGKKISAKGEIRSSPDKVLIKRNNDQIKEEVLKKLEGVRKKLKVRNIRQLRKQGVLKEVMDKTDVI